MKGISVMKIRFSLFTVLLCIAFVGVFLAGYRNGNKRGMQTMHDLSTRVEVFATIKYCDKSAPASNHLVQRAFVANDGETRRMSGTELDDLFVEITPTRITDTAAKPSLNNQTTIELKNISVADVEKQVSETMPHLNDSELVSYNRAKNTITIKEGSPELLENISALAKFSDKRPTLYEARLKIGKTMPDGSRVILYEPTIATLENLAARFEIDDLNETISVTLRFDDTPLSNY